MGLTIKILKNMASKVLSFTKALFLGKYVSKERIKKRIQICSGCSYLKIGDCGNMNCGICGCKVSGDASLTNLAKYEETPDYGCKHPQGSRWKNGGV